MFFALYTDKLEGKSFKTEAEMDEWALDKASNKPEHFESQEEYEEVTSQYGAPIVFGFEGTTWEDAFANKFIRPTAIYMAGLKWACVDPNQS